MGIDHRNKRKKCICCSSCNTNWYTMIKKSSTCSKYVNEKRKHEISKTFWELEKFLNLIRVLDNLCSSQFTTMRILVLFFSSLGLENQKKKLINLDCNTRKMITRNSFILSTVLISYFPYRKIHCHQSLGTNKARFTS